MSTTQMVETGKHRQITGFVQRFRYTYLAKLLLYRLRRNRDVQIIITSRGSTRGTGKTTLAMHICRWIMDVSSQLFGHSRSWNAEDYAATDLFEYLRQYRDSSPGDALLIDEIENSADRRRAGAHSNVGLSQAWSILRKMNVFSVATLPTTSMIDKRLLELADVWINVQSRGVANVYYLTVDDFTHNLIRRRMRIGQFKEQIRWTSLDDDEDFEILDAKKDEIGIPILDERNTFDESDINRAKREAKRDITKQLIELRVDGRLEMTQAEIGDITGYDQGHISRLEQEVKAEA